MVVRKRYWILFRTLRTDHRAALPVFHGRAEIPARDLGTFVPGTRHTVYGVDLNAEGVRRALAEASSKRGPQFTHSSDTHFELNRGGTRAA
jgi:hypothetical protein